MTYVGKGSTIKGVGTKTVIVISKINIGTITPDTNSTTAIINMTYVGKGSSIKGVGTKAVTIVS